MLSLEYFHEKYHSLNGTNDIWVAYSGGIDSRVLLELCYQYINTVSNYKLQAIHINHGLHKDSDAWAIHCGETCKALSIPLHVVPIKLDTTTGASIEELARQARRLIWKALLPIHGTLLLAHHAQDQAETILHRLFRGSGPTGLAGMTEHCKFGKGLLLRPLLKVAKADIDNFAETQKLVWVIDSSNKDSKFDRNFIRHAIIPELSKRWPAVVNNIIRSGELCAETKTIIDFEIQPLMVNSAGIAKDTLSIKKLLALDSIKCFAVLRAWIEFHNCQMPSRSQLYRIKSEVMLAKIDATPKIQFSQYIVRRYRDDLYLLPIPVPIIDQELFVVDVHCEHDIKLTCGSTLRLRKTIGQGFTLPANIKELTIVIGSKGQKAKKIFQQHSIPPWQRHNYPLVFIDELLICIVGLWVRANFVAMSGQPGYEINQV